VGVEEMAELAVTVGRHDERIEALERWQKDQNDRLARIEEKLDRFHYWLVGTLGGIIVSLILLVINLVTGK